MQRFDLTLHSFLEHAAKWHPNTQVATATAEGTVRIGYAELHSRARGVSALLADMGVRKGDHVATLAWNSQAHVEAWYGIMGMGAVCHTLNVRLTARELAMMLDQSGARILIASADLLPLALDVARLALMVSEILVDGPAQAASEGPRVRSLDDALADISQAATWGGFDENAPSGLCFTSGTTGAPKGVTYTHRSSFLHTLRLLQADVIGLTARDTVLAVVPMFHANAWGLPFAAPAAGARLVLPGRDMGGPSLARLIAEEGVSLAVGVPTVWIGLLDHVERTGTALPSLKRIMVGGAPMPPALMNRLEARLGVRVQTSWGMTELSPLGTMAPADDLDRSPSTAGRPAVGVDLMVADADGVPLPNQRGHEGRLHVRGAAVVERYFGQQQPAVNADGWFDTGDLAVIDPNGNLSLTGRTKDLIKSGGEWINPAEIEALVAGLDAVAVAAVIGRPDPKWGERPILLVELAGDASPSDDDLLRPVREQLAPWWVPDAVVRLDRIPLATTGKVDKLRLRREYAGS